MKRSTSIMIKGVIAVLAVVVVVLKVVVIGSDRARGSNNQEHY